MELYAYQREAVEFLKTKQKAYLSLDCGLGKTGVTLTALKEKGLFPVVVVCPAIARDHWAAEAMKWTGVKADPLETKNIKGVFAHSPIKIISYDAVEKFLKWSKGQIFGAVIFDEAHYLKSNVASRTKHCLLLKESLAKRTGHIYFLSGTPAPNHAGEVWPAMKICGAVEENYADFVAKYCNSEKVWLAGGRYVMRIAGSNTRTIPELRQRMRLVLWRKTAKDVALDLPGLRFSEYVIAGNDEYVDAEAKTEEQEWSLLLNGPMSLEQIQAAQGSLSGLRRIHSLRKIKSTVETLLLELDTEPTRKTVVFAHHVKTLETMKALFEEDGVKVAMIHGGTSAADRKQAIDSFQNDPEVLIFLGSITATGTAVNLHSSSTVVFVDMDYVPGNNHQAISRLRRIGQLADSIYARWFVLADSFVDKRISELVAKKTLELSELLD